MNIDNLLIEEDDIKIAQEICNDINNVDDRNKAVANVLGPRLASKFFNANNENNDIECVLHKSNKIIENFNISDIYVNGSYIDVRICFNDDDLTIPQKHFDYNIIPVAYMFIKISENMNDATILGFILPENIDKSNLQNDLYYISYDSLISYYDIKNYLVNIDDPYTLNEKDIFSFIDNDQKDANVCIDLIKSISAREIFLRILNAKSIFNFISNTIDINNLPKENKDEFMINNNESQELEIKDFENNDNFEINVIDNIEKDPSEEFIKPTSTYDFNTTISPNIEDIENFTPEELNIQNDDYNAINDINQNKEENDLFDLLENDENDFDVNNNSEFIENSASINTLYTEDDTNEGIKKSSIQCFKTTEKSNKLPIIIGATILTIGLLSYFGYNKFLPKNISNNTIPQNNSELEIPIEQNITQDNNVMPIESVEKIDTSLNNNEPISTSIPAIEQNLDASVIVENLKIDWEVPAGYTSNVSVKRYLVKLGKIIQLNLKTELLLLNKPPITNEIRVELKYVPEMKKFETVEILTSSGETEVDNTILSTIDKTLGMHINSNSDSFASLKGNPILVIKL